MNEWFNIIQDTTPRIGWKAPQKDRKAASLHSALTHLKIRFFLLILERYLDFEIVWALGSFLSVLCGRCNSFADWSWNSGPRSMISRWQEVHSPVCSRSHWKQLLIASAPLESSSKVLWEFAVDRHATLWQACAILPVYSISLWYFPIRTCTVVQAICQNMLKISRNWVYVFVRVLVVAIECSVLSTHVVIWGTTPLRN